MIKSKDREMPLEGIVICKDCEYWNKKQSIVSIGWDGQVHTGADFYCEDAKSRSK